MSDIVSQNWKRFVKWFIGSVIVALIICAAIVIVINPYNNLPISPNLKHGMMDINQRWEYPQLARDITIDSAVFGTSSIRLLEPERLEKIYGGHIAQMAMNSATAWEQKQLFNVFLRNHPNPKTVIIGIDDVWCAISDEVPESQQRNITFRGFPDWMYDDNPWNDLLYVFNGKAVEVSFRKINFLLKDQKPAYSARGWANFLPPEQVFDLNKTRLKIYGSITPQKLGPDQKGLNLTKNEIENWSFITHVMIRDILAKVPISTKVVFLFVPYHQWQIGHTESYSYKRLSQCKSRFLKYAEERGNVDVVDFMFHSPLTTNDSNYWDDRHYRLPVARNMLSEMERALAGEKSDIVRILYSSSE